MPALLLHALETRLAGGLRADAAQAGLHEATARVLLALGEGEAVPMAALARRVGRDPTTATRFVDRAAAEDLVTREAGRRDRRRRLVRLTVRGREVRARLAAIRRERTDRLVEEMQTETGLHRGQIEWFLDAFVRGLDETASDDAPR